MSRALVLSGGSIKGAFQAGAIAEVLDSGYKPESIYGTSVGSLNGAFLADRAGRMAGMGLDPDWPAIGRELETFWREQITSFAKIGRRRCVLSLGWKILTHRFDGLVDTRSLRTLVRRIIAPENLRRSPAIFSPCTVNIADGRTIYAHAADADILDYIIASAAIPVAMPITYIGLEPHLDGGIREIAPLKRAIDNGAEEIVCIVCQPERTGGAAFNPAKLLDLIQRIVDIVSNELVNNDLKRFDEINHELAALDDRPAAGFLAGKRRIPITVIRPDQPISLNLEKFTPEEIDNAIGAGRAVARKVIRG